MPARLGILLLFFIAFPSFGEPDWNTLFRGVVKVVADKNPPETGAGLVVEMSPNSIRVVTASHIVEDGQGFAKRIRVYFSTDKVVSYEAHLLDRYSPQERLDLAVLEIQSSGQEHGLPRNIPMMPVRDRGALRVGEQVWTVNSDWIIVPNIVVALSFEGDPQQFQYTKGATDDGFSGGPVFDGRGRIVGLHRGRKGGAQFAEALKADSFTDALAALDYNLPNLIVGGVGEPGEKAPGSPCFDHIECMSKICVNYACAALKQRGSACSLPQECVSKICIRNQMCIDWLNRPTGSQCFDDLECTTNICLNQTCAPPKPAGSICVSSLQCQSQLCINYLCVQR